MEFCMNVTVSRDQILASSPSQAASTTNNTTTTTTTTNISNSTTTTTLEDFFSAQNMEVDVSLEWLSVFVEDCLSSSGNCVPLPPAITSSETTSTELTNTKTSNPLANAQQQQDVNTPSLERFMVPGKARSKRKRVTSFKTRNPFLSCNNWSFHFASTDPPLLQQAHWLADSELIMPQKQEEHANTDNKKDEVGVLVLSGDVEKDNLGIILDNDCNALVGGQQQQQQPRRCTHCLSQRTPQWRAGPLGPKTLCNACGVRYKSGRLLPEYRPAKSPTFVSFLHSNSHKKVLEMRSNNMATRE